MAQQALVPVFAEQSERNLPITSLVSLPHVELRIINKFVVGIRDMLQVGLVALHVVTNVPPYAFAVTDDDDAERLAFQLACPDIEEVLLCTVHVSRSLRK